MFRGRDPADNPLLIACRHGDADIVRILLSGGAAVHGVDISGKTALHLASSAKPSRGKET
jgi:ankyrin repeat protein